MSVASTRKLGYTDNPTLPVAVFEPRSRRTDIPLIFIPGLGAGADATYPQLEWLGTVDTGIVGVSADLSADKAGWGRDSDNLAVDDVIAWAAANHGTRTDQVAFDAGSMGGLTILNWAKTHMDQVAAIALAIPAIDLAGVRQRDLDDLHLGIAASIEAAYGGFAGYTAALPTHSPALQPTALSPIAGRIRGWYASNDNVCAASEIEAWATANGAEITNVGAIGHTSPTDGGYHQSIIDWLAPRCWWG